MRNRQITFNAWLPALYLMLEAVTVYRHEMIGIYYDDFKNIVKDAGLVIQDDQVNDKEGKKLMELMQGEDWIFIEEKDYTLLQYSGYDVKNKEQVFEGDICELVNDSGKKILVICEFGTAKRIMAGAMDTLIEVDINGFYFMNAEGKKTFPIVNNYTGKHDLKIMKKVGNIYKNSELAF